MKIITKTYRPYSFNIFCDKKEDKVIIICEPATNLDALMVRHGAMAFIKKTLNEIVIAVDINFIVKSRLNAK